MKVSSQSAFPYVLSDGSGEAGMTYCQWLAGMAMQGLIASNRAYPYPEQIAEDAYEIVDAMLKKEEKC